MSNLNIKMVSSIKAINIKLCTQFTGMLLHLFYYYYFRKLEIYIIFIYVCTFEISNQAIAVKIIYLRVSW